MTRLKPRDIKPLRDQLLEEQNGLCALCQEPIDANEAVLDHDHRSGHVRAVLHRGCNAYAGHLENNQRRNLISPSRLSNILANFQTYVVTLRPELHPTYRTPEERQERARKRARQRRLRSK